jgi:hypothetical protein
MEIHPLTRTATISFSRALFQGISKNKDWKQWYFRSDRCIRNRDLCWNILQHE